MFVDGVDNFRGMFILGADVGVYCLVGVPANCCAMDRPPCA